MTYLEPVENSFGCRLWEALVDAEQTGALFLAEFQKDFCIILVLQSRLLTSSQSVAL